LHDTQFPAGRFVGIAPAATSIFVGPNGRKGNLTDSVNFVRAISYIFNNAETLGEPCLINISRGAMAVARIAPTGKKYRR
jgi:hypothetical protein